jgi:hypothetical protein
MDALRLLPGNAAAAGEPAQPAARDAAARWRQELERAQWALQTRQAGESSKPSAPAGPVMSSPPPPAPSRAHAHAAGAAASARAPASPAPAGDSPSLPARAQSPGRAGGAEPPRPAAAAGAAAAAAPRPERGAPAPAAQPNAARAERVAWPRAHVHVAAQGAAAHVWVRDAALGENERRRLAAELAQRLRAAGLHLAALTVNGEQILTMEGVTSWQSKQ